jgi:transcriptional repressor NrdR
MKCPQCGHAEDRVLETRVQPTGDVIRRRRECLECKNRFSTVETLMQVYPMIVKKDGRREPFVREKVLHGLQAACQKRPISLSQLEQIADRVAASLVERSEREVPAARIGQKIMSELHALDHVAYVRFASVYRDFKDVQEFVSSLEEESL